MRAGAMREVKHVLIWACQVSRIRSPADRTFKLPLALLASAGWRRPLPAARRRDPREVKARDSATGSAASQSRQNHSESALSRLDGPSIVREQRVRANRRNLGPFPVGN